MLQEAESPPISFKQEARDYVYSFMHPEETEEYRLVTAAQAAGEEELDDDSEDEDECQ